jgi:predicted 2-oxoglutarate/Fe(II)-dependent dioxygenase YbiX
MPPPRLFAALGLFTREGFLDRDLRDRVMSIIRGDGGAPATIGSPRGTTLDPSIRRAWETVLPAEVHEHLAARLDSLRPDLESTFAIRLGIGEGWSALRYPPGAFYRPHRDRGAASGPAAAGGSDRGDRDVSLHRAVSVVVFVNGPGDAAAPFDGGALRFYGLLDDPRARDLGLDLIPEAGTLVAFDAALLHEVTAVTAGERYSLVTWIARAD